MHVFILFKHKFYFFSSDFWQMAILKRSKHIFEKASVHRSMHEYRDYVRSKEEILILTGTLKLYLNRKKIYVPYYNMKQSYFFY